jgi:hypothetical protein
MMYLRSKLDPVSANPKAILASQKALNFLHILLNNHSHQNPLTQTGLETKYGITHATSRHWLGALRKIGLVEAVKVKITSASYGYFARLPFLISMLLAKNNYNVNANLKRFLPILRDDEFAWLSLIEIKILDDFSILVNIPYIHTNTIYNEGLGNLSKLDDDLANLAQFLVVWSEVSLMATNATARRVELAKIAKSGKFNETVNELIKNEHQFTKSLKEVFLNE